MKTLLILLTAGFLGACANNNRHPVHVEVPHNCGVRGHCASEGFCKMSKGCVVNPQCLRANCRECAH